MAIGMLIATLLLLSLAIFLEAADRAPVMDNEHEAMIA
jgi:hypothetical protein